jgi:RNA polymerase-binding protein DksA
MSPARKPAKKTSKRTAAKNTGARKASPRKKPAARKPAAKKATSKKTSKKSPRRTTSKKTTRKPKTAAKKKTTSKKPAPKKAAAKKTTAKTTAKKSTAKSAAKKKTGTGAAPRVGTFRPGPSPPVRRLPPAPKPRRVRPAKFDKKDLAEIKERLASERSDLARQVKELDEESFQATQSDMTGEVGLDDDFADAGSATFDRENALSIGNNIRDLINQIDNAIRRIDEGTYGTCERCGRPIDAARLKALPHASLCMDCKRREERIR